MSRTERARPSGRPPDRGCELRVGYAPDLPGDRCLTMLDILDGYLFKKLPTD